ncbi:MAG TPA: succinate dehydrogenase, hydrophobic membrane anchor protein [Steroidobacteraceae bacterium]|nr:succinate dehydrogenase, hydrophobic membrane anchor protein [Steroidobacteraceae bacterium]
MSNQRPSGSGHWIAQRVSAVALIPLGLWFIWSLSTRADLSRPAWLAFIAAPWHAALIVAFLLVALMHSYLGVQVVIEDYVHTRVRERALHGLSTALHFIAALAGAWAVIRIVQGGAP